MPPSLDAMGLVVADMAASLAFYRRLGLDIPADADQAPHVEVALSPGGWTSLILPTSKIDKE